MEFGVNPKSDSVQTMLLGTLEAGLHWTGGTRVWNTTGEHSLDDALATGCPAVAGSHAGVGPRLCRLWDGASPHYAWSSCPPCMWQCLAPLRGPFSSTLRKLRAGSSFDESFVLTYQALRSMEAALDCSLCGATTCTLRYLNAVKQRAKAPPVHGAELDGPLYILTSMALILAGQTVLTRDYPDSPPMYCRGIAGPIVATAWSRRRWPC